MIQTWSANQPFQFFKHEIIYIFDTFDPEDIYESVKLALISFYECNYNE